VQVFKDSDNYEQIFPQIRRTGLNDVLVDLGAEVPTTDQYRVVVKY
jgi:hypothetical protein